MENKVSVCRGLLHTFVEEEWPAGSLGESMHPILGEESASQISINLWVQAGAVVPIATVDSDIKTFDNSSAHLSRKRIGSSRVTQLFRNMGPGACIIYVYGGYRSRITLQITDLQINWITFGCRAVSSGTELNGLVPPASADSCAAS